MLFKDAIYVWLILLLIIGEGTGILFNQPKFCSSATWDGNGITFADNNTVGSKPYGIFVNAYNSVYVTNRNYGLLQVWHEGNITPTKTFHVSHFPSWSLLVTLTDDIYIDNNDTGIDQWALNSSNKISTLNTDGDCYDLVMDHNQSLYCALPALNKIIRRSLNSIDNQTTIVAGTGCAGIARDMLDFPMGTFVDFNYDLYVADSGNNRIQRFHSGESNGVTVAGQSAPGTIVLYFPTDIVLDGNGYLFIVDCANHRIVGSDANGFRCIAGCTGFSGLRSDQLKYPAAMAFDNYGNIFVTDNNNNRTQKFLLATNVCDATTVPHQTWTSPTSKVPTTTSTPAAVRQQTMSYNRPRFCGVPSWNSNATTFAYGNTTGPLPLSLFLNTNNTLYAIAKTLNRTQMWFEGNINPTSIVSNSFATSASLFVTNLGDIFVDHGYFNGQVDKWSINNTRSIPAIFVTQSCHDLFIDTNNTLYCSLTSLHQVVSKSLDVATTALKAVAGTGCPGSMANMLRSPNGIFVDINFDLYVADSNNNRIQCFSSGQMNATTVAGNGSTGTISLYYPTAVVLDGSGYLFIVDRGNSRIVGSGPSGFQCLIGCSGTNGAAANQLHFPFTMAFDTYGNIFVADTLNDRIQKFTLETDLCDTMTTSAVQTTTNQLSTQFSEGQSTSTQSVTYETRNISLEQSTSSSSLTSTTVSNQTCFAPVITLFSNVTSLSTPLEFQRSEDIFIGSQLQLNCEQSLSTINQWKIYSCTANCSLPVQINQLTTSNELFIPARSLSYGTYLLKLSVSMLVAPHLTSSVSVYMKIISSSITANLVQYGTSMISHGYQQDLLLDPGTFSVDPDTAMFNASNWNYEYYCRIYGRYDFPNLGGSYLTIDDPTIDRRNPSCLSNRTALRYGGANDSIKSSLSILANSLKPNQTYQFIVRMKNRYNPSVQGNGFLLVQVVETQSSLVVAACVISTLCTSNEAYQRINPKTQVAVFSVCTGTCPPIVNIVWNIYHGEMNLSSNMVQWILFNQTNQYRDIWFYGLNTANLTSENRLFTANPSIEYWRFEVVYSFTTETTSSALNFITSQPPQNGFCSISPQSGTTSTLFTISCPNWQDQDGIQDYSFYSWTSDVTDRMMLAFSAKSTIQLRLPAGTDGGSSVHVIVYIRDKLGCVTKFNLPSVTVVFDSAKITNLVEIIQSASNQINTHPFAKILANGNQNNIGQMIGLLSQRFNQINRQSIRDAIARGVSTADITVSSLNAQPSQSTSATINSSALIEYNKRLNIYARVRDYLIKYTTNLVIAKPNSIILQAFALAQLTQATNQMTRTTSMLASEKCYQLAVALSSMANKIPAEDVRTAATQIAQCANNALSAINGPLQKRTSTLDLDSSRANTLPEDYDTDLESEWANMNLFGSGDDSSWEDNQISRNVYYQRQMANKISSQTIETISLLTSALNIHLNTGQNVSVNIPSVFMSLETTSIESLSNKSIEQTGNARIQLPKKFQLNSTNNTPITLRSMVQPLASFGNARMQPNTNLSRSVSLTFLDQYGKEILIRANTTDPIKLLIPRDPAIAISQMTRQYVTATNTTPHHQVFNLHFVNISSELPISVHFEIQSQKNNLGYLVIYQFDRSPILNSSMNQIDGWTLLCPANLNNGSIYTYFIDNEKTIGHQSVIFGIRELNSAEMINSCSNMPVTSPPITDERFNFTADYDLRVYTSGCYYLDANNNWQGDGLVVGPSTNHYETECYSTHLTTFAGGFIVLPAPINWNYVFANADFNKNKTVYITLICVSILYLLFVIYARYKDKKDVEKLGVTPLSDNHRSDQYFYQILVFTGHRKGAGTKSKVHFVLSGDDDETQVRTLTDPKRAVLQRGGIDAFIMTVPKSLGPLNFVHIWHDNTGKGTSASWFLKYIIVRDLQTMAKTYFICQKWFAVEKGDGVIERVLPAAGEYQKREFSYVLSKQAYHSISEGHLWLSIFSRPPSNKFTRVQRCTCCFVLLLTAMLLNILYYDQAAEAKANNKTSGSLALGPLYITPEQISIGVVVEILSFLPSILLVQFFRRIRPRRTEQEVSPLRKAIYQIKQQPVPETPVAQKQTKKCSLTFPWWCLFIAYGISLIFGAISMFFIIARGIEFGDLKTQKWLTSLLSGFFSSILLIQPLKVLSLAIFFAFFFRNTDKDREAEEFIGEDHPSLDNDEEYLHSIEKESPFANRSHRPINRLDRAEVVWARDQRLQEIEMWAIIREVFHYATFLALLYFVTYSNINQQAFYQVRQMQKVFLNTRNPTLDYTKISTVNEYWTWLNNSFVGNLRAQNWYNNDPPRNLSGYISDKSNRLIGWAVMRQLRVQPDACRVENAVQHFFNHCHADYSFSNQDKQSFTPEWINQTKSISNSSIDQAFVYQSDDTSDSYMNIGKYNTYDSGGYIYQFRGRLSALQGNLTALRESQWIDSRTRAVIIELTLYNPNSELFTAVTLLTEFLPTGGVEMNSRFEPVSFQVFKSIPQLICFIFYMIFIIYMMILQIQSLMKLKLKYFKQFWSMINLGIIICSWTNVGIYIWRYQESNRIGDLFASTNGYVYINLQMAVYISDLYIYLLGFCCFFGTIQFLHLFRFNHRILFFMRTLQRAGRELIGFAMMFSIVFMAFLSLFYLIFVSKLWSCSSLLLTAGMLFEMTLMKFDTVEMSAAASFLGPFCFTLFIFVVVFVCLSMFLTIINDSFRFVREHAKIDSAKDPQILSFMLHKFLRWTGLGRSNELEQFIERDEQMRSKYVDPIEQFPEKIDQLLEALNRIYIDQQVRKPKK